jgi:hypothetical protein
VNVELLLRTKQYILDHPDEFRMVDWNWCICGIAHRLAGKKPAASWSASGMRLLGVPDRDLFGVPISSPIRSYAVAAFSGPTPEARAQAAADLIDAYMALHGAVVPEPVQEPERVPVGAEVA